MKRIWRWFLIAALAVVVVGLAAPRVSANRFRPRIQAALEAALNRPVHLGAVHLNLFTGPGFSVDDVLIDDDPAAGIEPFAHVESMQARIRWLSLFSGNLEFSSLRLDTPSVNVVRMASGPWNIQPLLDHPARRGASRRRPVPDIQIRGGRIDFKFGDTKSVFYINGADVDVYPNENGEVVIRFSGSPARTDQSSQSFGELTARGLLRPGSNGEGRLSMGVHLDRTAIAELTRLFHGSDIGVHGYVSANAKLSGPLSRIDITGDLNASDVHRWDLMPAPGEGWTLNYRGLLNLTGHHLELASLQTPGQTDPVALEFQLDNYLAAPKWSGTLQFRDLPATVLVDAARRFGAVLPPDVKVDGKVEGQIGYASESGAGGQLTLESASVKFPEGGPAAIDSAQVRIANGSVVLAPSDIETPDGQSAQIEGEYALDGSSGSIRISARHLTAGAAHLRDVASIPLLEQLHQGSWNGWISYEKTAETRGVWSGQYDLQNAVIEIPGLAAPVRLSSAAVQMKEGAVQLTHMRGRVGKVQFEGDYRYDAAAARPAASPEALRLVIPELQVADLQALMLPTLRRNEGFLARFRRGPPLPAWLDQRNAEVSLQIASLMSGDVPLGTLAVRALWRGATITANKVDWRLSDMHASGKIAINLAKADPEFQVSGAVENFDYRNGQLDITGDLASSGLGTDLLLNLRSKGTFDGRDIMLAPDSEVREVSGSYRVDSASGVPRLLLADLQVLQSGETLVGQGASQPDGRIVLELASGRKQVRLTGMLLPVHPDPAPAAR